MTLISYVTRIHFADAVLEEAIAAERAMLGLRRPLVVTDHGIVAIGLLERLLDALKDTAFSVFDETPANPTEKAARSAAELYRERGCDSVIAFGGGSPIDLAKVTALLASHDGPLSSYAAAEGGIARIRDILPSVIAIPTTGGTGSEVGRGAQIVFEDGVKRGIESPYLVPKVAICDPTLTLSLPPALTAGTGMDALTHCVETYISAAYNPPADGIALDGLRRAADNIQRAVEDGCNIAARREMMAAALNGALALQKGLGGVHAMSHALGGAEGAHLHHGTLNAVLLPHMLVFNAPASDHRYTALKDAIRLAEHADLGDALLRLTERVGLPTRLGAMGVDDGAVRRAAPLAEKDHNNGTNPRRATSGDYLGLMRAAL
jgi:4-hydroxybutyrate dehydrogenase